MDRIPSRRKAARAFTLIELLLVLVILAVLAAVVIPNMLGRGEEAKHKATLASIQNLVQIIKTYEIDNGSVPDTNMGLNALVVCPQGLEGSWKPLLDKLPKDGWGHEFIYRSPSTLTNNQLFDIVSMGRDGQEGTADDLSQLDEK